MAEMLPEARECAGTAGAGAGVRGVRPVRRPSEQVYDHLRDMILAGELPRGQALPPEAALARDFGVSPRTIQGAMRALARDGLIGAGDGKGSIVMLPTVEHVAELLEHNVGLLSQTADVTLGQFLEVRELIEVFAVREASHRRTPRQLELLRRTLVSADEAQSAESQYVRNRDFHRILVAACGNPLLSIAAQPIFAVMHTNIVRSHPSAEFSQRVHHEHEAILTAIESGSAEAAEAEMRRHLDYLRGVYQGIWRPRSRA